MNEANRISAAQTEQMNAFSLDEKDIKAAFQYCDSNHENTINLQECRKALSYIGYSITEVGLESFLRERYTSVDINKIKLGEFVEFVRNRDLPSGEASRGELVKAFNALDMGGNGLIRGREIKRLLGRMGEALTEEEMEVMMKGLKEEHYLSSEDFVNLLKPLAHPLVGRECSLRTWELIQKLSEP